jgi:hypothetical protein
VNPDRPFDKFVVGSDHEGAAFDEEQRADRFERRNRSLWQATVEVTGTSPTIVMRRITRVLGRGAEEALTAVGQPWVVQEGSDVEVLKASVLAGLAVGGSKKRRFGLWRTCGC